jgi:hypothetical protein
MLSFLGGRYENNGDQGKHGQCNRTNHREDYARLNQIANRNLSRPQRVPLRTPYRLDDTDLPRKPKAVLVGRTYGKY